MKNQKSSIDFQDFSAKRRSVSGALIAIAFAGQASSMGTAFFVFSLVLFPALLFMGLFTFKRVAQSGMEDLMYARGITRAFGRRSSAGGLVGAIKASKTESPYTR